MAKKKKSKKSLKSAGARHALPPGFWLQTGAVVLTVLALLLVIGMFGAGGPVLGWLLTAAQTLFGWAVYLIPVLFVYMAIEIFRAEQNQVPAIAQIALWLFLVWIAS